MDFAEQKWSGKRIVITVVAASGKNWPKEKQKYHIILNWI